MEITVSKRFLRVPVKFDGTSHKFTFSENGTPVYKFDAVYTEENADAVYYADLRDYLGKTMTVTVEPECTFTPVFEDAMTPLTAEETVLRPQLHFTAERGWINDPNGLCFYGGQYHLFYQHNPYGRLWGNMHWGHAVSPDLFHWEYKEEAMFLDMDGAMFSGCAVVDHNNVSGLKEGDETPILFFYTCAGEKKSTQCLAYSTDGGKTLKKYDKNPLIDEIAPGNRDPKVIYDAKRARWLMALYFVERTYAIFTSQDLLHWDLLQKFDLPGDDECPDLYPLTADDGRTLWVYSGAHDMYFVGDFDENGLYQPIQSVGQLSYNSQSYAAQTYYYEPGKPVLHDVTLYAKPGQKVAFVGATGAGKTTITNLLNRFYDIADGKIRYDNININKIRKPDLRRSLGIVLQDTNLFTGTVMENIRYGNLEATDEQCIQAAKLAGAHDFITRLPKGYETELTGNGGSLSQGQRQLLSIARAAVADPPVMILDEATSSIDTRTEALVQKGMDALMEGRTTFVIAHRLSTVRNADCIMVLDHGRIIERGTHQDLIARKGTYYRLYTGAFELE